MFLSFQSEESISLHSIVVWPKPNSHHSFLHALILALSYVESSHMLKGSKVIVEAKGAGSCDALTAQQKVSWIPVSTARAMAWALASSVDHIDRLFCVNWRANMGHRMYRLLKYWTIFSFRMNTWNMGHKKNIYIYSEYIVMIFK